MKIDYGILGPNTLCISGPKRAYLLTPCRKIKFSLSNTPPIIKRKQWFVHIPFLFICIDPWEFWG